MKRILAVFILLTFWAGCAFCAPAVRAQSWIAVDRLTGTVLTSHNEDLKVNPGNTTALMVLYSAKKAIADGKISQKDKVRITKTALTVPPLNASRVYVENNRTYSVSELIEAVAVTSANDASVALSEHIGGSISGFVQIMNENAKLLGMESTHYVSPIAASSEKQYSTARDTYRLSAALIQEFPELEDLWTRKNIRHGPLEFKNSNSLIWKNPHIRGIHASDANHKSWSVVGYYSEEQKESENDYMYEFVAAVLNAPYHEHADNDAYNLLTWSSSHFKTILLYTPRDVIDKIPVALSADAQVRVGVKQNVYLTIPKEAVSASGAKAFSAVIERMDPVVAPVRADDKIGTLHIYLDKTEVESADLYAQHNVKASTIWYEAWKKFKSFFD